MNKQEVSKEPITLTRDELYKQVWQTPLSRLAAAYGITGNGLAKICDRLKVPYPFTWILGEEVRWQTGRNLPAARS